MPQGSMRFEFPDKQALDAIIMLHADKMTNAEYRDYYLQPAGTNHYRLLNWISRQYSDSIFFDIGTMRGTSAMALASNPSNRVVSYDILDSRDPGCVRDNVEYVLGNALADNRLLDSGFVLLDIVHDGEFEYGLYDQLIGGNYRGVLMVDDIFLDPIKNEFWEWVSKPKVDLTEIGHFSGTGLIDFG